MDLLLLLGEALVVLVHEGSHESTVGSDHVPESRTLVVLLEVNKLIRTNEERNLGVTIIRSIWRKTLEGSDEVVSQSVELVEGSPVGLGDRKAADVTQTPYIFELL